MLDHFALGFTDVRIHWETSFEPTLASSKNVVEETVMEAVRNAELRLDLDQLLFREVKIAQNVFMVGSWLPLERWSYATLSLNSTRMEDRLGTPGAAVMGLDTDAA